MKTQKSYWKPYKNNIDNWEDGEWNLYFWIWVAIIAQRKVKTKEKTRIMPTIGKCTK